MDAPMTRVDLRDAIAKAIADAVGHGMREKCERQADAVMAVIEPQLLFERELLPTVVIDGKYDNVLIPFTQFMAKELHDNAGKGDRPGWLQMTRANGMLEIYYHAAKLQKAVKDDNVASIREYAADVANMAMMLLDVCGGLEVSNHREQPDTTVTIGATRCFGASWFREITACGIRFLAPLDEQEMARQVLSACQHLRMPEGWSITPEPCPLGSSGAYRLRGPSGISRLFGNFSEEALVRDFLRALSDVQPATKATD